MCIFISFLKIMIFSISSILNVPASRSRTRELSCGETKTKVLFKKKKNPRKFRIHTETNSIHLVNFRFTQLLWNFGHWDSCSQRVGADVYSSRFDL